MILTFNVRSHENDWEIISSHEVTVAKYTIPSQSLTSVDYYNVEGRVAKCSFYQQDTDIVNILLHNLSFYIHPVTDALTTIECILFDEVLNKTVFTGLLASNFNYDDLYQSFEDLEIYDGTQMLIKYWLPYCYNESIYRVIGSGFDELISASLFDNDYSIIPENERVVKMFPYVIEKDYQDDLQAGRFVTDFNLGYAQMFLDYQDGMTPEEFYQDLYISDIGNDLNNLKFFVRKSNAYFVQIDYNKTQLVTCFYTYRYFKQTLNPNPALTPVEKITETIYVRVYEINSLGEIETVNEINQEDLDFLTYGENAENIGELTYQNRLSSQNRLYDTYYLNLGYQESKGPLISNYAGDSVALIPGEWTILFTGTYFINDLIIPFSPENIKLFKALLLTNNLGIYSKDDGTLVIKSKYNNSGTTQELNSNNIRTSYIALSDTELKNEDLEIFINSGQVIEYVREGYLQSVISAKKGKQIITANETIDVGDAVNIDGKRYYITSKDRYKNYPFITYKGRGEN